MPTQTRKARMMTGYQRYGVYFLPEDGPLAEFGAAWLGWDCAAGAPVVHPDLPGLPAPVSALTEMPRRYGFHATLKPPFRLAEDVDGDALDAAVSGLGGSLPPAQAEGLALAVMSGFVALVPTGPSARIDALAAGLVQGLDGYRAAPGADEQARRRRQPLTERQEANLAAWGYPYVMQDFRFHMTLTGKLAAPEAETVRTVLAPRLEPLLPAPFRIEHVCLVGEDAEGRFHLIHRYPLLG